MQQPPITAPGAAIDEPQGSALLGGVPDRTPQSTNAHETGSQGAPGSTSEGVLVARLQDGDAAAFEELVRDYGPRMLAVVRRYLSREADAEDALQDAFLNVWRSIRGFAGESRLATWLHRVAVNAALMRLRSRRRRPEACLEEQDFRAAVEAGAGRASGMRGRGTSGGAGASALDLLAREDACVAVRSAIEMLPEECRIVVRLRDIEGMQPRDIGETLGLAVTTVKTRLHRGRMALRSAIDTRLRMTHR